MDATVSSSGSGVAGAGGSAPTSTELMIALSQIQQLIPLLDYRPGGLTHLVPTLLTPLMPVSEGMPGEAMQRYRANVDHAFRVAGELVARVQDATGAGAATALALAESLMKTQDQSARMLRVRKKRRLFVEQEKLLETNNWGPPVPPRRPATATATGVEPTRTEHKAQVDATEQTLKVELQALLPSQNPPNLALTPAQQDLPPPHNTRAVAKYLVALHSYLQTAVARRVAPGKVPLNQIKARVVSVTPLGFTLEVKVAELLRAVIDATTTNSSAADGGGDDEAAAVVAPTIDLAGMTVGGVDEAIVSSPSLPSHRILTWKPSADANIFRASFRGFGD